MAYLDKYHLLHSNQHGFRKKLSCETQLIQFVQDISDTLNESGQTGIIVMDFSKDKIDHKRLLLKLQRFGINNDVITWIGSFLSNRTQRVVLESEESDTCPVMSSVPQGSVLGPCLFLLFRAIRYIFNDYSFTSSVSNMLSKLNIATLEKRRQISSLTVFYKIKHHLVNIPFPGNIQPSMIYISSI